jgi:hypothetical protein
MIIMFKHLIKTSSSVICFMVLANEDCV